MDEWLNVPGSFIAGNGTTNEPREYVFVDANPLRGNVQYRLRQVDLDGTVHYSEPITISVATDVKGANRPSEFALHQNYPNPFNPSTTIKYDLPEKSRVKLEVVNTLGQVVRTLVDDVQEAGFIEMAFDASKLSSGIYLYRIQAGSFVATKKFVLIR
jgi:hypothetical protein